MDKELNAGSRSQVEKLVKKTRLREDRKKNNLTKVVSTYEGREFLWDLLEDCGIYRSSFRGDTQTEFREGQRAIGLSILTKLHTYDENLYIRMQQEAARRRIDGLTGG